MFLPKPLNLIVLASAFAVAQALPVEAGNFHRTAETTHTGGLKAPPPVMFIAGGTNGHNVTEVYHAGGRFYDSGGGRWTELGNNGAQFNFVETGRDDWSVYLNDPSRNLQIQIDLHRRLILWGQNGGPKSPLYNITDAAGGQGQIGDAISQEVVDYNCNEGIPMQVTYTNQGNSSTANVTHDGFRLGELTQIPSGSGSAYSNGRHNLYTKGREAILEWDGITDVCFQR